MIFCKRNLFVFQCAGADAVTDSSLVKTKKTNHGTPSVSCNKSLSEQIVSILIVTGNCYRKIQLFI